MTGSTRIADRYEIVQLIGQGGMGDVFRAQDCQTGESVAIKRVKSGIVDQSPDLMERFGREGEALRALNHPNIIKMLATIDEGGEHYLVMQYASGGSLRNLLEQHPRLPIDQVLSIGIELADALTRAHHLKIIHRDLKPENVLLTEEGNFLLSDFGVAHLGTRTRVTETGSVIGTYAYLSPEACLGEELDGRTDIWAFGVMLYEMLAGRRPFESEQSAAILLAIMSNPIPDLAALRPDTPPALVELIYRMLAKPRDQRISSVRQVGAALEAILAGTDTPGVLLGSDLAGDQVSRFTTPTPSQSGQRSASSPPELPLVIFRQDIPSRADSPPANHRLVASAGRRRLWLALGGLLAAVMVMAALMIWSGRDGGQAGDDRRSGLAQMPGGALPTVPPVAAGEYMVLVADLEPLDEASVRDVARFVRSDLRKRLENEIPYSNIRIRAYPAVIRSEEEARAAAELNGASVVVWGNYTPEIVELEVQIGVTTAFPHIAIGRAELERAAEVRVHLTNEHRESVVAPVLGVLNVLHTADGDSYEVSRILAILSDLDVTHAEVVGGGLAGDLQRAAPVFVTDTAQAIQYYDAAVGREGGNPIPYCFRAVAYLRLGLFDKALRDVQTAQRLGPAGWAAPLYQESVQAIAMNELDDAIRIAERIVAQRPDDWFAYNFRGTQYYLRGDHDLAETDLKRAVELGPTANFPYLLLAMLALREGDLLEMQAYQRLAIERFPDPSFSARLMEGLFGNISFVFTPMLTAAGSLVVGQYEQVITNAEAALAIDDQRGDMYLIKGLSYCNLGDFAAAEDAYTRGLAVEPDFVALYALRAEARIRQGDFPGSLQDTLTVQKSDLDAAYAPLIVAAAAGEWHCETFFSYDYSQLDVENDE